MVDRDVLEEVAAMLLLLKQPDLLARREEAGWAYLHRCSSSEADVEAVREVLLQTLKRTLRRLLQGEAVVRMSHCALAEEVVLLLLVLLLPRQSCAEEAEVAWTETQQLRAPASAQALLVAAQRTPLPLLIAPPPQLSSQPDPSPISHQRPSAPLPSEQA